MRFAMGASGRRTQHGYALLNRVHGRPGGPHVSATANGARHGRGARSCTRRWVYGHSEEPLALAGSAVGHSISSFLTGRTAQHMRRPAPGLPYVRSSRQLAFGFGSLSGPFQRRPRSSTRLPPGHTAAQTLRHGQRTQGRAACRRTSAPVCLEQKNPVEGHRNLPSIRLRHHPASRSFAVA